VRAAQAAVAAAEAVAERAASGDVAEEQAHGGAVGGVHGQLPRRAHRPLLEADVVLRHDGRRAKLNFTSRNPQA
jgi:hypothetical protein